MALQGAPLSAFLAARQPGTLAFPDRPHAAAPRAALASDGAAPLPHAAAAGQWLALAATLAAGCAAACRRGGRGGGGGRSGVVRHAATATALDLDVDIALGKKTGKKTDSESESKTSKDMWVVLVHAPIRNCHMPWCKIPGLRRAICTCMKENVEPGGGIRSKDGKCALTLDQYAEVLSEGVPILPRSKSYEVAARLFESAMANPVGTAVVIGAFKRAAEDYHERLTGLGLWTSVAPVDRDD